MSDRTHGPHPEDELFGPHGDIVDDFLPGAVDDPGVAEPPIQSRRPVSYTHLTLPTSDLV